LASVPRPRIYDVLESLVGKGLATDRPGRTAKYAATPPDRVAGQLMLVHRERLEAGEQGRFVEQLPMRLSVIDERTVRLALPDLIAGRNYVTTLVIEHPHLARTLKIGFESVWATGVTLTQACRRLGIRVPRRRAS
jgi:hypothetical protein